MFWVKEYCKHFKLNFKINKIYNDEIQIGSYDAYEDIVYFGDSKYLSKHLALAIIENFNLHGDDNVKI